MVKLADMNLLDLTDSMELGLERHRVHSVDKGQKECCLDNFQFQKVAAEHSMTILLDMAQKVSRALGKHRKMDTVDTNQTSVLDKILQTPVGTGARNQSFRIAELLHSSRFRHQLFEKVRVIRSDH